MARFSDKEKILLKEISKRDCISDIYSLSAKVYGIKSLSLLLIKQDMNNVIVLTKETLNERMLREELIKIISVLSFIDKLEKEGLVYIINDERNTLFCSKEQTLLAVKIEDGYEVPNYRIEFDNEKIEVRDNLNRKVLTGQRVSESLSRAIGHFLGNSIYPTGSLLDLVHNNFKLTEDKALKYTKYSFWTAIFAMLLSMFAVPISNKWGVTTLDSQQYDSLIKSIKGLTRKGIVDSLGFENVHLNTTKMKVENENIMDR